MFVAELRRPAASVCALSLLHRPQGAMTDGRVLWCSAGVVGVYVEDSGMAA